MALSVRDVLVAARARITDPRHFIRGNPDLQAINNQGRACSACDPSACRWTARGAVTAEADGRPEQERAYRLLDRAARRLSPNALACQGVLCCQEHAAVLRIYDEAIKTSEKDKP